MLSFIHKHYQSYASRSVPANKNVCKKIDVAKTTGLQLFEAFHFSSV